MPLQVLRYWFASGSDRCRFVVSSTLHTFVAVQTSNTDTRRGRIRVMVGSTTYYIIVKKLRATWCQLTAEIHKAAILEAVSTGENIEFKFTVR